MAQIGSSTKNVSSSGYGSGSFVYRIRNVENSYNIQTNVGNHTIYFDVMPVKSRFSGWSDTNATFRINTSNGQSINADSSSGIRNSKTAYNYNSYVNIASWTGNLTHKDDGTLDITTSITYGWSSSEGNYLPLETNITNTSTATTIPRFSDIQCPSPVDMGSTQTVSITQKSTEFSHIVFYKTSFDSGWTELGRGTASKNYSWVLPNIPSKLPNANFDNYTLLCQTFINSNYEGEPLESTLTIQANVPSRYVPTIAISSIKEGNSAVPSGWPYVVGYSKLNVSTTFTGSASSTVASRAVRVGNETITSDSSTEPVAMQFTQALTATSNQVYASTVDSRGRTGTATQNVQAVEYASPTIAIDVTRCQQNGTIDAMGEYALVRAKWSWTNVNNLNSAQIKINVNGTQKAVYNATTNSQTTWQQIAILSNILATSDYTITAIISDILSSSIVNQTVTKATMPFSLFDDGTNTGASFGRMATEEGFRNYMNEYVVSGNTINLLDTTGKTVIDSMTMDDLFNGGGGSSKFIYNQPITLYDTDGTTVLSTKMPQDLLFAESGAEGEEIANNAILANVSSAVTFGSTYVAPTLAKLNSKGSGFEISNGQIKCNKSGKIYVSLNVNVYRTASSNEDCYIQIFKNDVGVDVAMTSSFQIYARNLNTQTMIDVVAGDLITFKAKSYSVTGNSLRGSSTIYCEYIEDYYIQRIYNTNDVYSLEEVNTGKLWINNKPIYRLCYQLTSMLSIATNTWVNTPITIGDKEVIINSFAVNQVGTYFGFYSARDSGNYVRFNNYRNTVIELDVGSILCIEYTKTTD